VKEENPRECKDRINELLPWYLNRTLPQDQARKVEAHLKVCPKCQKELEEIKWLSSEVKAVGEISASPHIQSEKLLSFTEEPERLSPDERVSIEKHIKSCASCYKEMQTLKSVNLELQAKEKEEKPEFAKKSSFAEKIAESLVWLVRKPVFAYVIAILLAYPAARWLLRQPQSSIPPVAPEKVYMLSEQTRTPAKPTIVLRDKNDRLIRIDIPFWPDLDNNSYELMIKAQNGQTIFEIKSFAEFGSQGISQLVLNSDSFSDGSYILIVKEINRKDPTLSSQTNFPFRITKEE
jgi:hypothetical protein